MAGLDFKTTEPKEQESDVVIKHNTKIGVIMFFVYVAFYGGFMGLSAFSPETMSTPSLGGVNLSVLYGFLLIVLALVLAMIYMKLCKKTGKAD